MSIKDTIDNTLEKVKEKLAKDEANDPSKPAGANPDSTQEQMHPAVNKEEPEAFANPVEAGAKKSSEDKAGIPQPKGVQTQEGSSESCSSGDVHTRTGNDPHTTQEQMHPAVNKEEPEAFANPCESGAKKPSEDVRGQLMPESGKK